VVSIWRRATERLQRLIDSPDRQIDALVYELYELTPEEIAVVEGQSKDLSAATMAKCAMRNRP
jgi:hypothetical protein